LIQAALVSTTLIRALTFAPGQADAATPTQAAAPAPVKMADATPAPTPPPPVEDRPPDEGGMTFSSSKRQVSPAATPASEAPPTPGPTRALTMEQVSEASTAELSIHNIRWRYSLNFFGDASLSWGSPTAPDNYLSFSFGAQDVLLRGELGNHIVASTEMAFEPGPDGIGTDIERYNVRWQSPEFFVEVGRSHTVFGYWNNAYHHGRWLQPTIERPRWVAFEDNGGMLPVHWVGLNVGGKLKMGASTLNLVASIGNGRGRIVDDVRNDRDYQSMKAFQGSAELVGLGWPELRIGVAAVADKIPPQPVDVRPLLVDTPISEFIGGAHVAYASVPLVLIVETYMVVHRAVGQQWTTFGGFGLVGYTIGRVTPYFEVERVDSSGPSPDPFFIRPGIDPPVSFNTVKGILGTRVDLSDWTAIKFELRQTHYLDGFAGDFREAVLNWSWGF
jgi:hypothetical protein